MKSGALHVCVAVFPESLLRPGDDWRTFDNVRLLLDGEIVETESVHEVFDETVALGDEQGNVVATGPYSDMICWPVELGQGLHTAQVEVWTTTGEEFTYSWMFEVAD